MINRLLIFSCRGILAFLIFPRILKIFPLIVGIRSYFAINRLTFGERAVSLRLVLGAGEAGRRVWLVGSMYRGMPAPRGRCRFVIALAATATRVDRDEICHYHDLS